MRTFFKFLVILSFIQLSGADSLSAQTNKPEVESTKREITPEQMQEINKAVSTKKLDKERLLELANEEKELPIDQVIQYAELEKEDQKSIEDDPIPNLVDTDDTYHLGKILGISAAASKLKSNCRTAALSGGKFEDAANYLIDEEIKIVESYNEKIRNDVELLKSKVQATESNEGNLNQKSAYSSLTQIEAFDLMIDAQRTIMNNSLQRKTFLDEAKKKYKAARNRSIIEAASVLGVAAFNCPFPGGLTTTPGSRKIRKAYTKLKETAFDSKGNPLKSVIEKADNVLKNVEKFQSRNRITLVNPIGRAFLASAARRTIDKLKEKTDKQYEEAQRKIDKLEELKKGFILKDALADCTQADFNNPSSGICYCYTPSWEINPSRSNLPQCQSAAIAGYKPEETEYADFLSANGDSRGCITSNYQDDRQCNCKANNSCLSLPAGQNINGLYANIRTYLNSGSSEVRTNQDQSEGKFATSNLADGSKTKNAAFSLKEKKEIIAKLKQNPKTQTLAKRLESASTPKAAGNTSRGRGNNTAKKAEGENTKVAPETVTTVNQKIIKETKEINEVQPNAIIPQMLDFSSLTPESTIADEGIDSGTLKVKPKTKIQVYGSMNSPVKQDNGQSIFEVITNRYQKVNLIKKRISRSGPRSTVAQ